MLNWSAWISRCTGVPNKVYINQKTIKHKLLMLSLMVAFYKHIQTKSIIPLFWGLSLFLETSVLHFPKLPLNTLKSTGLQLWFSILAEPTVFCLSIFPLRRRGTNWEWNVFTHWRKCTHRLKWENVKENGRGEKPKQCYEEA